jgi:hypothetical protein
MKIELLKELKKRLPKNYTETLSKRCGVSAAVVSKVLNGKIRDYHNVVSEAVKLKKQYDKKLKEEEDRLRKELE